MPSFTSVFRSPNLRLELKSNRRRLVDSRLRPVRLVLRERRRDDDVVLAAARPDGAVGVLERELLARCILVRVLEEDDALRERRRRARQGRVLVGVLVVAGVVDAAAAAAGAAVGREAVALIFEIARRGTAAAGATVAARD